MNVRAVRAHRLRTPRASPRRGACSSGRRTRRRTPSQSASNRSALSAMRSFTSRKRASVLGPLDLVVLHRSSPCRFVSREDNGTRRRAPGYAAPWRRGRSRSSASPRCCAAPASTRGSRSSRRGRRPRARRRTPSAASRAQIVKSLVFVCDGRPVIALVPGDRRADERRSPPPPGAGYARVAKRGRGLAATGFEPGGVAPFPAPAVARVLMERELLAHELVWVGRRLASGTWPGSRRSTSRGSRAREVVDLSELICTGYAFARAARPKGEPRCKRRRRSG